MNFDEEIINYYERPYRLVQMTYKEVIACNLDCGYYSTEQNGTDFHRLSRDIVLSAMKFENGHITNLVFSNHQPLRLELQDKELNLFYCDYIEIRFVLCGHMELEIENTYACFEQNDICLIDSMAAHRERVSQSEGIVVNIGIDRTIFNEAFLSNIGLSPLQKFLRANIMKQSHHRHYLKFTPGEGTDCNSVKEYLSRIFYEVKNTRAGYLEISKGYIIRLMDHLTTGYDYHFSQADSIAFSQSLFESVDAFIKDNLSTVSLEDLSEQFHYQTNYFNNLIKKHTGLTYSQFLITQRMEKAKTLLSSTNLSIDEIMFLTGYNNKGFFYSKFTDYTGMKPASYRKKYS